ncbi:uncharacterized protein LOC111696147 isoform X2 [Eurytemora carolleeae]|uniref:uncharacterized protein LOC111696147 isoform X2 n=1 Tax=Eurytemora carolleeae TaxID=1294199 RepID=UPI000C790E64|nr:uncharacterized protein LOC111696147 isoform X2 [Eurytemora carolleeae]|eukprot:XP_023321567.1 uncharacterized protein LOC111696147 isoform X2 [Eurytemora affinis]
MFIIYFIKGVTLNKMQMKVIVSIFLMCFLPHSLEGIRPNRPFVEKVNDKYKLNLYLTSKLPIKKLEAQEMKGRKWVHFANFSVNDSLDYPRMDSIPLSSYSDQMYRVKATLNNGTVLRSLPSNKLETGSSSDNILEFTPPSPNISVLPNMSYLVEWNPPKMWNLSSDIALVLENDANGTWDKNEKLVLSNAGPDGVVRILTNTSAANIRVQLLDAEYQNSLPSAIIDLKELKGGQVANASKIDTIVKTVLNEVLYKIGKNDQKNKTEGSPNQAEIVDDKEADDYENEER